MSNYEKDLPVSLLINNFDSKVLLLNLRHQDERTLEWKTMEKERQSMAYHTSSRGFQHIEWLKQSKSSVHSSTVSNSSSITRMHTIKPTLTYLSSKDSFKLTADLTVELLADDIVLYRKHWQKSKCNINDKIIQNHDDLILKLNISMKKTAPKYELSLLKWFTTNAKILNKKVK
ncbi:unnamed protein product [Didymodactylos carnosus]|uniref:Uncharacterized protein n=1 Tax=Didymodactylos carnosus TaxID=1234261 RepID=A0A814D9Q7_9BILA|nr:unnamed protein product [Didymodactylos carnosus]CAF0976605.1 unnamed protein product [Didymodactylos carnosus]CAF3727948.1 unnamed protein product [Didymodactylos carnosus]CAF3747392.1 unnamed protein product [Didymodactylos carnosus]